VDDTRPYLQAGAARGIAVTEQRLLPPDFAAMEAAALNVQASELERILTWAAERIHAKKYSSRSGGGAGGRGRALHYSTFCTA